ncbi:MAG TPA: cyclic nucleotide-binding domain-containing protein [Candidatus Acidoferrales bacterium]|nr:cyclic nucleotide-binding domain-containing protein [Candidatus Acidoferrales bacterium]
MEPQDLTESLHKHPFLSNMDESLVKTLTSCASNIVFKEGTRLFREGDDAKLFFLVRSGRVVLETQAGEKGTIRIQTVGPGEVLGWSWLISPFKWHFDAIALEQVHAFSIDASCLRTKCETDNHFGYEMLRRFSEVLERRLAATRLQLLDIYGSAPAESRWHTKHRRPTIKQKSNKKAHKGAKKRKVHRI